MLWCTAAEVMCVAGCGESPPPAAPPPVAPPPVAIPVPPAPPPVPAPDPEPRPAPEGDDRLPFEKEADPVVARSLREFENLRLDPSLQGLRLRICGFRPFIVAVEETDPGKAEAAAAMAGKTLTAAYAAFRATLKDLAGLDLPLLEDVGDERIRVVLFADDASFARWLGPAMAGRKVSPTPVYRRGDDRRILASVEGLHPRSLGALAAFALLHHYQRHLVQQEDDAIARKDGTPIEKVLWDDGRLRSCYWWLDSAFADHVGKIVEERVPEGDRGVAWPDEQWTELLREARKSGNAWGLNTYLWADQAQVRARAKVRGGEEGWERLVSVHEVQSRILFRTLLEAEEGRWREGLGRLLRNLVEGKSGQMYLLESFGLPKRPQDPKVTAWIAEVEAACLRTEEGLFAKPGK